MKYQDIAILYFFWFVFNLFLLENIQKYLRNLGNPILIPRNYTKIKKNQIEQKYYRSWFTFFCHVKRIK